MSSSARSMTRCESSPTQTSLDTLLSSAMSKLRPPPRMTISQWADERRILSRGESAEPGGWRTDRALLLREIMDVIIEPDIHTVVFMKPAQIGGSEIVLNTIGLCLLKTESVAFP